jgi:hypothetical protein
MISWQTVRALRDARRRLGQSEDLFVTRPLERQPERRQPDDPDAWLSRRRVDEFKEKVTEIQDPKFVSAVEDQEDK